MKKQILLTILLSSFSIVLFAQTYNTPTPQWRPVYHFTPEKNWTNDPNGLIYLDGKYLLYNQQNPFENVWGHMSWGHATSTDLINWKHLPVAIPEKITGSDTTWIFSGSAVLDKNNTSGFCKTDNCIVAIYTAHSPNRKNQSQYIAYSNDGGMTFTNYDKNPVIDLNKFDFRDPNVFWYEPGKYWLMTVVVPDEHKAQFYASPNLKEWSLLSEFGPQGYTGANWECPFLIQLPVEGTNTKKWMLVISAAGGERGVFEQYFVGDFDGKTFKNDNPANTILPVDYGDTHYAAIPWNNAPNDKKIYIGWMIPKAQPTYPWRGQMSIPRDLSLHKTDEGIRLFQVPTSVITSKLATLSKGKIFTKTNIGLNNEETVGSGLGMATNSYWIDATFTVGTAKSFGFNITQSKDSATTIIYNTATNELSVKPINGAGTHPLQVTIKPVNGKIHLQVLFDKSSLEVFANDGEKVITTYVFPKENETGLSVFSKDGSVKVDSITTYGFTQ